MYTSKDRRKARGLAGV